MNAVYRRVPLHFGRSLFRVRAAMGRHDNTDYDWKIWKGRERDRERKSEEKIKQNTKFGDDSARICPRESRGFQSGQGKKQSH